MTTLNRLGLFVCYAAIIASKPGCQPRLALRKEGATLLPHRYKFLVTNSASIRRFMTSSLLCCSSKAVAWLPNFVGMDVDGLHLNDRVLRGRTIHRTIGNQGHDEASPLSHHSSLPPLMMIFPPSPHTLLLKLSLTGSIQHLFTLPYNALSFCLPLYIYMYKICISCSHKSAAASF